MPSFFFGQKDTCYFHFPPFVVGQLNSSACALLQYVRYCNFLIAFFHFQSTESQSLIPQRFYFIWSIFSALLHIIFVCKNCSYLYLSYPHTAHNEWRCLATAHVRTYVCVCVCAFLCIFWKPFFNFGRATRLEYDCVVQYNFAFGFYSGLSVKTYSFS